MEHLCDNCGAEYTDETLHEVIRDLAARVTPGGLVPSGECTECGALCYPKGYTVLTPAQTEDLEGICSYTFEFEFTGFIEVLRNEPAYIEEKIITEEEVEELGDCSDARAIEIVDKAAYHPQCLHIYGLAAKLHRALHSGT